MLFIAAIVAAAWAGLLGAAYLARVTLRRSRIGSAGVVLLVYAGFGAASLVWLGPGQQGFLAAFGLLLPCAVALATVIAGPSPRRRS